MWCDEWERGPRACEEIRSCKLVLHQAHNSYGQLNTLFESSDLLQQYVYITLNEYDEVWRGWEIIVYITIQQKIKMISNNTMLISIYKYAEITQQSIWSNNAVSTL